MCFDSLQLVAAINSNEEWKRYMIRRVTTLLALVTLFSLSAPAADTYSIDPVHSEVSFQIRHLVSKVRGRFNDFQGTIQLDTETPENSSLEVQIDVASVDTKNERRDNHLRSADFFDVENHPSITFKSTKVVKTGENTFDVTGMLSMHGVSHEVTLPVVFLGTMVGGRGITRAGFEVELMINRKDYAIEYNRVLEAGGVLLGDEVTISINIEARAATGGQ